MDTSELLKKVRKIEIKTKNLSNHIFSGEYHSTFKGRGMSFSEVREYQFGDDVRNIDWNVTARYNSPFVKVYEEERELTVMLIVDVSDSSFFGTVNQMKNHLITEICAVLAFSATNNNDKVGMILFGDKIEKFIPPKKGKSHILRIIRELLGYESKANKTDIGEALSYFSNVIKKKCISFLISDFMDSGYEKALDLAGRKHDLIGIHVSDPREETLPNVGLIRVKDSESGEALWLDTSSKNLRMNYEKQFVENYDRCRNSFLKSGADLISVTTDVDRRPYVRELMNFFKKRGG